MVILKSDEEILNLRIAGKLHARILSDLQKMAKPGITTGELDMYARDEIAKAGDIPSFYNYTPDGAGFPYPAGLCVSVNDEIVHGIPGSRVLAEGDIVGLDLGVTHNGSITDAAISVCVGEVSDEVKALSERTRGALYAGIDAARSGKRVGDISCAIEKFIKPFGYGVPREIGGHGVGRYVHEDPFIPNYCSSFRGPVLKPGMVLALEPMFSLGGSDVIFDDDGYTIRTKDGSTSAHFEHTILITENEAEILTA